MFFLMFFRSLHLFFSGNACSPLSHPFFTDSLSFSLSLFSSVFSPVSRVFYNFSIPLPILFSEVITFLLFLTSLLLSPFSLFLLSAGVFHHPSRCEVIFRLTCRLFQINTQNNTYFCFFLHFIISNYFF